MKTNNSLGVDFLNLFKSVLDSYDIENTENNTNVRNLRNYLGENIELLENDIINILLNMVIFLKVKKTFYRVHKNN